MKSTMLQQVMEAPRKITFRTVPVPQPKRGQVLIEVKRVGICGSDIHVYHGMHPLPPTPLRKAMSCPVRLSPLVQMSVTSRSDSASPSSLRYFVENATPADTESTTSATS